MDAIRRAALPLQGIHRLVERLGTARLVLIGEASHGTHEFYALRAELTRRLIAQKGFNCVAVEADWPDAYRVNRWVRHASDDRDAQGALGDFTRFPRWMWRNRDVVAFIAWLRSWNADRAPEARAGFYGLDLYSFHASAAAVLDYLAKVDPPAAARARERYACFGADPQAYGYAASLGLAPSCEEEALGQLVELRRRAADYALRDGRLAADEHFFAEQNARLLANAEAYYRAMFGSHVESWNLRDRHMMETLSTLIDYLGGKTVVWAHNSHLGDARATEMGRRGELNLGQLVREAQGDRAMLVGFTTHRGTVTAASNWDEPAQRKRVRPSLPGSYERLFHDAGLGEFWLPTAGAELPDERLERAIGVIYRPQTERLSHYFGARLAQQFDAVIHIDETTALEPLERWAGDEIDLPETYPHSL